MQVQRQSEQAVQQGLNPDQAASQQAGKVGHSSQPPAARSRVSSLRLALLAIFISSAPCGSTWVPPASSQSSPTPGALGVSRKIIERCHSTEFALPRRAAVTATKLQQLEAQGHGCGLGAACHPHAQPLGLCRCWTAYGGLMSWTLSRLCSMCVAR